MAAENIMATVRDEKVSGEKGQIIVESAVDEQEIADLVGQLEKSAENKRHEQDRGCGSNNVSKNNNTERRGGRNTHVVIDGNALATSWDDATSKYASSVADSDNGDSVYSDFSDEADERAMPTVS